jgi:hypothetical protein
VYSAKSSRNGVHDSPNPRERLQIMLTDDELAALDNWRFEKRMPSRAAAVRELLKRGRTAEGFAIAEGSKSRDFGIVETKEPRK